MSFLNPVSEPVLRFSSTDASAPQINYNARVAGDVKAVLKACLVTGYGTKASAGWSIVNEVNHVAEFVSPSAAMSDYRLGIDDTSASSTAWYYQYQNAMVNPNLSSAITKNPRAISKTHASNGWQLLVTGRGIAFIENFYHTVANAVAARLTYWSLSKSAVTTAGNEILFFCAGQESWTTEYAYDLFYNTSGLHSGNASSYLASTVVGKSGARVDPQDVSNVDALSDVYVMQGNDVVAVAAGFMAVKMAKKADFFGVDVITLGSRSYIKIPLSSHFVSSSNIYIRTIVVALSLDDWEY